MNQATAKPRVLFYVQHLLGIGHLARASRITRALTQDGFDVTMVTGGMPVPGFPGPDVKHVALPAIASGDASFSGLTDADGKPLTEEFKAARRDMLLATLHDVRPDIVFIEAFPFGRRQVRFELIPLLDEISRMTPRPLVLTSLRDILQERTKPGRDEESVALVQRYFDRVLVHGDPQFARLEDSFALHADIADRVIYTGLVAAPPPAPPSEVFDIVVSAGGGAVGALLIYAAVEAAKRLSPDLRWCIVTGPNLPQADFDTITAEAPDNVRIFRFLQGFPALLLNARLSVSQAGYNTVCDILRADCRALLIPFTTGGETEQIARARHLEKLGLAAVLTEDALSAESMTDAIVKALAAGPLPVHNLDLDGAHHTARILHELLAAH